jgi:hypothetical protein
VAPRRGRDLRGDQLDLPAGHRRHRFDDHGLGLLNTGGTWVVGDSASFGAHDATISAGGIPASPWLSLRLDLDASGNVTAYINGTLVHTTTVTALGITLDTDTGSVYRCGVVGEPGHAALDSFEVWTA